MDKIAFVTVGSTQFDALVDAVLGSEVIRVLQEHKCTRLVIQAGNSPIHVEDASVSISDDGLEVWRVNAMGLDAEIWRFKPSLELDFRSADLVICHAGSGTLLEVMRMGKKVVAVPNPTLLHNHQTELAEALDSNGYLVFSTIRSLTSAIKRAETRTFAEFPKFNEGVFRSIIDEEMGF